MDIPLAEPIIPTGISVYDQFLVLAKSLASLVDHQRKPFGHRGLSFLCYDIQTLDEFVPEFAITQVEKSLTANMKMAALCAIGTGIHRIDSPRYSDIVTAVASYTMEREDARHHGGGPYPKLSRDEIRCVMLYMNNKIVYCEECLVQPNSNPLVVCGGCRFIRYCGKACQRKHWHRAHQKECPRLDRVKTSQKSV